MVRKLKLLAAGAVLSLAAFLGMPSQEAQAGDYCREYTRTVYIGGRAQDAYGTACLQPDGSWMIVGEGLGNDIPDNVSNVNYVIHDNRRDIVPTRVVYYDQPRVIYRTRPVTPIFTWYNGGHYRNGHHVVYKKYNYNKPRYDRHDRWDRRDDRGRGRGNGHR